MDQKTRACKHQKKGPQTTRYSRPLILHFAAYLFGHHVPIHMGIAAPPVDKRHEPERFAKVAKVINSLQMLPPTPFGLQ